MPDGFVRLPAALTAQTIRTALALSVPESTTTTTTATTTPTTTATATTTFDPGPSSTPFDLSPGQVSPTASGDAAPTAPTQNVGARSAEVVSKAPVPFATPALRLASAGGERFAVPIILVVGMLALAFGTSDILRRRLPFIVTSTRRRRERRRNQPTADS